MSAIKNNTADLIWKSPGENIQITSMTARLGISELYQIRAQIKSPSPDLSFMDWLYAEAQIVLKCGEDLSEDRIFSGIITELAQGRTLHGNLANASKASYFYEVDIRPSLWLLSRNFVSKVFQKGTLKDFITEVLGPYGIKHAWQIEGPLLDREYCIQYEETDYAFISRLLEEEGICFFFDMEKNQVTFCNKKSGFPDCKPKATARYVEEISPRMAFAKKEFVSDFFYREALSPGKHTVNHYNYETSQKNIKEEKPLSRSPETAMPTSAEVYEHSCNYPDRGVGARLANLRIEGEVANAKQGRGVTTCRSFDAGYIFEMTDHFRGDFNAKWLLTSCVLGVEQGRYRCDFTATPAKIPYRPVRKTPRPKVVGLQTAVVVGPDGTEVYLDEMGRCRIQFHWDREGPSNDRSSMWVRCNNNYAGKDYGIQWIPRVGHEVVVTFIDGNPDLPIVTGRVYNDFQTAPLGPAQKWQNIIKTIKDNHILFDDRDNHELVDFRAQKDMNTLVLNDKTLTVGHDETVSIGHNAAETVKKNKSVTVEEEDYTEKTGRDKKVTVFRHRETEIETGHDLLQVFLGDRMVQVITGQDILEVMADHSVTVKAGNDTLMVEAGTQTVTINQSATLNAAKGRTVNVSDGDYEASASKNLKVAAQKKLSVLGTDEVVISSKKISITATQEISIGVGPSTIVIKPDGITISGPKITSAAIGIHEITGAMVKLN